MRAEIGIYTHTHTHVIHSPHAPSLTGLTPEEGKISERDFAKMILSYADINDQQKKKYNMKRVKRAYEDGKVRERERHRFILCNQVVCVCFTPL